MHIICSFIEPSGVTLACDDIQNNFEADLHNSQETISKKGSEILTREPNNLDIHVAYRLQRAEQP